MATVTLHGLAKTFGDVEAVRDLDLDIGDGEFFVLLGPSGAGKTTTLKCLAGLEVLNAGSVSIGGRDMTGVEPYHRNVAMAFESYALYPQKTVRQNLESPLRSNRNAKYTDAERTQRIDLVTTTLGIHPLLERFPRELSNGQRQRVSLGRVLVRPADVYLLDEPLSHLDAKLRAAMRAEFKHLGEMSKTTSLYVTHDYQEALALGDRIGVLHHGRLLQVGTPRQIWLTPADTFVARALGQPEMNLIDAHVDHDVAVGANGALTVPVAGVPGVSTGDDVRIGVRPSDLEIGGEARPGAEWMTMHGRVLLAEHLGRMIELSLLVGDAQVIGVAPRDRAPVEGDQVDLHILLEHVHVFAGGDEGAITPRLGSALRGVGSHDPAPPVAGSRGASS